MSNYLSQPISYAKPPADANFELLSKVALLQQQKYDVNHQQIQATLDAFGAMKTLRPEDDAYIAAKLNSITTQINSARGNLASQSLTDSLMSRIKGAANDPFILNAMEQTKKMQTVQAQMAELKKKDPNLVNDKNYKDMLDLAGYGDYMAGKADKLGTLTYNPYVDVTATLHKKAAEYSKERGLKDEYLGTEQGTFETVDKYGNKVTEREIQQYLYSSLGGAEKTQMQIDARADYKYMPQADFNKILLADTTEQTNTLKNYLAKLEGEASSQSASDKVQYTNLIAETKRKITENEGKISNGTFDKNEMYNYHAKNVINGIAANYDIDRITKVDRSDLPFEIMKFETETELKREELALKKLKDQKDAAAAAAGALGTATTIPTPTEEVEDTGFQRVRKDLRGADAALDAYLKANNQGYKNMTPEQQWNYKLNLKISKPTVEGGNATLKTLSDNFHAAQGNYATIVNNAKPKIIETVKSNYNNLIGGRDLNVDNLAGTMPLTASLLKSKKPFDKLSKEEQLGVVTEFASNNLQYNSGVKGDVRALYEKVIDSNKAELARLGSPRAKQVAEATKDSSRKDEFGILSTIAGNVGALAKGLISIPMNAAVSRLARPINELFGGEDYAEEQQKSWNQAQDENIAYIGQAIGNSGRLVRDLYGGQDTNITELERKDLRAGSKRNVQDSFNDLNSTLQNDITKTTSSYLENLKETKAFTFSTDDKAQKATAIALRGAILATNQVVPPNAKDFTVVRSGSGFNISYLNKDGDAIETAYVDKLPDNVASMLDASTQNWNNSPYNPNIKLTEETIRPYVDPNVRDKEVTAVTENRNLTMEQKIALLTNPTNTAFATVAEVRDKVKEVYSNAFYDKNKTQIESILSTSYKAIPYIAEGAFYTKITYSDNGVMKTQYLPTPIGTEKDDYSFYLQYMEAVAKIRDNRIKALQKI